MTHDKNRQETSAHKDKRGDQRARRQSGDAANTMTAGAAGTVARTEPDQQTC